MSMCTDAPVVHERLLKIMLLLMIPTRMTMMRRKRRK